MVTLEVSQSLEYVSQKRTLPIVSFTLKQNTQVVRIFNELKVVFSLVVLG